MYKLIAVDMDGTLLKEDKTISEETKRAIYRAKAKGVKVVIATGRPLEGVKRYLKELDLVSENDYVLSFNGSLVQNSKTQEIVSKKTLKGSDLKYLYNLSKELGVNMHSFSKDGCITPAISKYTAYEGEICQIPVLEIDYNSVSDDEDIAKIMMVDEEEILDEAIKNLPKEVYEKYTVVRSTPVFLEFLNKEANKGEGVRALAEHLGIKQEQVICVGDAGNDLHMIQFAGLGVAMGNAFEEVKEVADYVTKTNEDDGVAHVIKKFVLAG